MNRSLTLALLAGSLLAAACDDDPTGVPADTVVSVQVSPASGALEVGDTLRVTASVQGPGGRSLPDVPVTWASDDTTRVTLAASGRTALLTARAAGDVAVLARAGGKAGSATMRVTTPAVARVDVEPGEVFLVPGDTVRVLATARSSRGAALDVPVTWAAGDGTILTVTASGSSALLTARSPGYTTVKVTAGAVENEVTAHVESPEPLAGSLQLEMDSLTVEVGKTVPLRASVWAVDGSWIPDPVVWWTSSDAEVATVAARSYEGRADVTALLPGVTTVRATSGGQARVVRIRVVAPPAVASVRILGEARDVWHTSSVGFQAEVWGTGGSVLSGAPVAWSVEDPYVAEVNALGGVTGRAAGSTRVWAESGGVRASVQLTVWRWPQDGKVTMQMNAGVDPWGTPRLLSRVGPTTWTDSTGVARQASLFLEGGTLTFHGDGRWSRVIELTVRVSNSVGILVTVERRQVRTEGTVGYDLVTPWRFHLLPGGALILEPMKPGSWITQESFGEVPLLPWRWVMQ